MKFKDVLDENIAVYASGATSMSDVAGTDSPWAVDWAEDKPKKIVRRLPKTGHIFRKKINKKDDK